MPITGLHSATKIHRFRISKNQKIQNYAISVQKFYADILHKFHMPNTENVPHNDWAQQWQRANIFLRFYFKFLNLDRSGEKIDLIPISITTPQNLYSD